MAPQALDFLGWLNLVGWAFALAAAFNWMRAAVAYHQGSGDHVQRVGAFVSHAAYGAGFTAVAIAALFLAQLPRLL